MKTIFLIVILLGLSACKVSIGENSKETPVEHEKSNEPPRTDGNNSYYGFRTSTTPSSQLIMDTIRDVGQPIAIENNTILAPQEFFLRGQVLDMRFLELAIFKPTCLEDGETAYYSALQQGQWTNSATAISLSITSKAITFYRHSYDATNLKRYIVGEPQTINGHCTNGEFILDDGRGSIFSNGKMLLAYIDYHKEKYEKDFYIGVKSSLQVSPSSLSLGSSLSFDSYGHLNDEGILLNHTDIGWGERGEILGSIIAPDTEYNGTLGAATLSELKSFGSTNTKHMILSGSERFALSLFASISGKHLLVVSMPDNDECESIGQTQKYCNGSIGISIGIEE